MAASGMSDMGNDSCQRAVFAAAEVISEECGGEKMRVKRINGNTLALVSEEAIDEFGFDVNSPATESDREEAIENCMDSEWARDWAESVVGSDAGRDAMEQAKRRVCEGLFD